MGCLNIAIIGEEKIEFLGGEKSFDISSFRSHIGEDLISGIGKRTHAYLQCIA